MKRRIGSILIRSGLPDESEKRKQILADLVQWSYVFSPLSTVDRFTFCGRPVEEKEPDPRFCGFNLDLSGSSRLFKGELNLIRVLADGLNSFGFKTQIAIAPSLGSAWAISRYGKRTLSIVSEQFLKNALTPLPITALRLSLKTLAVLNEVNVTIIGELLSIPRPALLSRFGAEVVIRLDQALDQYEEPIEGVRVKPRYIVEHKFDEPINSLETIEWAANELLKHLIEKVRVRHKRIAAIEVTLLAVPQIQLRRTIPLSASSLDFKHLQQLVSQSFEKFKHELSAYEAGVEQIILSVPDLDPAEAVQTAALPELDDGDERISARLGELIDRLGEKIGNGNVGFLAARESYIPERSFDFIPARLNLKKRSAEVLARVIKAERPSILFPYPQPVKALSLLPDGPPFMIQWKDKRYHVLSGIGPERIAPEWWGKDEELTRERDYFRVQLPDGTWLWVYRTTVEIFGNEPRWFLHGIWS